MEYTLILLKEKHTQKITTHNQLDQDLTGCDCAQNPSQTLR